MTPLPVPSSESYAVDINDSGVVVGNDEGRRRLVELTTRTSTPTGSRPT